MRQRQLHKKDQTLSPAGCPGRCCNSATEWSGYVRDQNRKERRMARREIDRAIRVGDADDL